RRVSTTTTTTTTTVFLQQPQRVRRPERCLADFDFVVLVTDSYETGVGIEYMSTMALMDLEDCYNFRFSLFDSLQRGNMNKNPSFLTQIGDGSANLCLMLKEDTVLGRRIRHQSEMPVTLAPYPTPPVPFTTPNGICLLVHMENKQLMHDHIFLCVKVTNFTCLVAANQVAHVNCGNCHMLLMYQYGARSVKCAVCNFVTSVGVSIHGNALTFYLNIFSVNTLSGISS
ncbi:hypothetical protein BHE74_00020950, partial [Ensete ventricosum]